MKSRKIALRYAFALLAIAGIAYAGTGSPTPAVGLYWLLNGDPTIAPGANAPLYQLGIRTDVAALYYKSGASNTAWTKIGSGTSGTVTGTGTANTTTKWTGTSSIGNGWAKDDGSTWGVSGLLVINEATGGIATGPSGQAEFGNVLTLDNGVLRMQNASDQLIYASDALASGNQNLTIAAAGTGRVQINSNTDGIGNSGTGGLAVMAGNNTSAPVTTLSGNGHVISTGAAAGLACNGTGSTTCSSATCTDAAGTLAINAGATSCTITFAATYGTSPSCTVSPGGSTSTPLYISARGATSITITTDTTLPALIDYACIGHT